jgi:hypothetical protein
LQYVDEEGSEAYARPPVAVRTVGTDVESQS